MPCSSIQKLCRAGERECATGHPMMPASRVLPVILIHPPSCQKRAAIPQKIQELQQWQAENGETVAANPREQLRPSTLETIGPDRSGQRFPLLGNIPVEKGVGEPPHRQFGLTCRVPQRLAIAHHTDRGGQGMGATAQCVQLCTRLAGVAGFVEPFGAGDEELIGADHQRFAMMLRYRAGLLGRKRKRAGDRPSGLRRSPPARS